MNKYNEKELAEWLHDNYREEANQIGLKMQEGTNVPYNNLPSENKVMWVSLAKKIITRYVKDAR